MSSSAKRSAYSDMPSDANHSAIVDTGYLLANKLEPVHEGSIQETLAVRFQKLSFLVVDKCEPAHGRRRTLAKCWRTRSSFLSQPAIRRIAGRHGQARLVRRRPEREGAGVGRSSFGTKRFVTRQSKTGPLRQSPIHLMVERTHRRDRPSSPQPPEAVARLARLYGRSLCEHNR
jgi:hypothetical protein